MYAACVTVAWCATLNALWIVFTLLGGIVLGIGPATVAACTLSRRRMRGEVVRARDFAPLWRAELLRGTVVIFPVVALSALLAANLRYFSAPGPGVTLPRVLSFAALCAVLGAAAYVGPMYAHYDLPLRAYLPTALRFSLARPASTVLLLLVLAALAFASAALPVLLATVSIGAWLHTATWLCVRFFEENEGRLSAAAATGPVSDQRILPVEPLRIR